jgi:hypothetical protein
VSGTQQEASGSNPLPDYVHAIMAEDQAEILRLRAELAAFRASADELIGKYDELRVSQSAVIRKLSSRWSCVLEIAKRMAESDGIGSEPLRYWAAQIIAAGEQNDV